MFGKKYKLPKIEAELEENVFVIGSLSQASKIKEIAERYTCAKYVYPEPSKSFEELVSQAFDNIEKANTIIVVKKSNGDIGQGTTYELEYAKRLNKKIVFID